MTIEDFRARISDVKPRLAFTPDIVERLKEKRRVDAAVENFYTAIWSRAYSILDEPILTRQITGRRLLSVSREMLYRVNMLGVVYLVEEDPVVLNRINQEVIAVSQFIDWHPSHFLGVAEMALGVALALDWTQGHLPADTIDMGQNALIEKALKPSWPDVGEKEDWWVHTHNNWNQVCHGGMVAAALAVFERDPELAVRTLERAMHHIPHALKEYAPDGVYPEGSSYWKYGTSYSVITSAMLESALGTDFGLLEKPGFLESALFRSLCNGPSGQFYNFSDCQDFRSAQGDTTLAWFALKTGNAQFFERERFLQPSEEMGQLEHLSGAALSWIVQLGDLDVSKALPSVWKGEGSNPVVIFRSEPEEKDQYYLGAKGGKATNNHGNMDAGSFVFELNGVRWVVDPGNQDYHELEQTGFRLWGMAQDSERWTLITKNNFGHSTLTVNGAPFLVDAFAPLIHFQRGPLPEAEFDLSEVYGGNVQKLTRRFIKDGAHRLRIQDHVAPSPATRSVVWQLLTVAEVEVVPGGARLLQEGQRLHLRILSHSDLDLTVVSLDPPPMQLDRTIQGLKRLEVRLPLSADNVAPVDFEVLLTSEEA